MNLDSHFEFESGQILIDRETIQDPEPEKIVICDRYWSVNKDRAEYKVNDIPGLDNARTIPTNVAHFQYVVPNVEPTATVDWYCGECEATKQLLINEYPGEYCDCGAISLKGGRIA